MPGTMPTGRQPAAGSVRRVVFHVDIGQFTGIDIDLREIGIDIDAGGVDVAAREVEGEPPQSEQDDRDQGNQHEDGQQNPGPPPLTALAPVGVPTDRAGVPGHAVLLVSERFATPRAAAAAADGAKARAPGGPPPRRAPTPAPTLI